MAVEVIMPKFDMDQETGTVMEWVKKDGDKVEQGDTILIIETDKVAVEVESPGTGRLAGVRIQEGEEVPIGTVIAHILAEGEQLPQIAEPSKDAPVATGSTQPKQIDGPSATPLAAKVAAANNLDLSALQSSKPGERITKADVERALGQGQTGLSDGKVRAVPAARRLARELDLDLVKVKGSGPAGRVQSRDVMAASQAPQAGEKVVPEGTERIPLRGIRKTIAERMSASYREIPHVRFTVRVDMTRFNQNRQELNGQLVARGEEKLSVTAMMVKLTADTLKDHPFLNSSLVDQEILLHPQINIGVAVAMEQGLIVPVVKEAERKDLLTIASEVNDLASRGRAGMLKPPEVKGATFTISNLGPFGIEQFDAIINPPEAAILAVGATQMEALPSADGSLVARPVMRLTLSVDHRIIDGAVAARFLADTKANFEDPGLRLDSQE